MLQLLCAPVLISLFPPALEGQGHSYGRANLISRQASVATSQVLASQAGAQTLAKGGWAVEPARGGQATRRPIRARMGPRSLNRSYISTIWAVTR